MNQLTPTNIKATSQESKGLLLAKLLEKAGENRKNNNKSNSINVSEKEKNSPVQ